MERRILEYEISRKLEELSKWQQVLKVERQKIQQYEKWRFEKEQQREFNKNYTAKSLGIYSSLPNSSYTSRHIRRLRFTIFWLKCKLFLMRINEIVGSIGRF